MRIISEKNPRPPSADGDFLFVFALRAAGKGRLLKYEVKLGREIAEAGKGRLLKYEVKLGRKIAEV